MKATIRLSLMTALAAFMMSGCASSGGSPGHPRPVSEVAPASLVGTAWRLVRVESSDGNMAVPRSVDAPIRFTTRGGVSGRDGCSSFGGHIQRTGKQYELRGVSGTDNGCINIGRVLRAVRSTVYSVLLSGDPYSVLSDGHHLQLASSGRSLIYVGASDTN